MSKKETDISQIRKYLNGELDARAMHRLERRAQHDPFLMDALEGYDNAHHDQRANLNEIAKRLRQRSAPPARRIIPWRYMAAAASILIVLTIGGLYLYNHQSENKQLNADLEKPAATANTGKTGIAAGGKKKEMASASTNAVLENPPKPSIESDQMAASRPVVQAMPSKPAAANPPTNSDVIRKDSLTRRQLVAANKNVSQQQEVASSVSAVAPEEATKQYDKGQVDKAVKGRASGAVAENVLKRPAEKIAQRNIVTGRVIETDHGSPVMGATVSIPGTSVKTHTNIDGYFTIPIDSTKDKLYIANDGYQSRQISTKNKDSLRKISLEPSNNSLSEEVVIGYGTSKKTKDAGVKGGAHPDSGWDSFNKYLKKNAISTDGSTGVVKLSFKVTVNGLISDIVIIKSLSKVADQKASELITNGPGWVGNANGQSEKVEVKIKFVKAK